MPLHNARFVAVWCRGATAAAITIFILAHEKVVSRQKEGDRNTSFFHRMATMRGRVNHLGRLRRGGRVLESPIEIKEEVA